MESHIQHIELINAYLRNKLSEQDRLDFENKLETDATFKDLFKEHRTFLEGLKRQSTKTEILKGRQTYIKMKWLKMIGVSAVILALIILGYIKWTNFQSESFLKSQLNFESEYVQSFKVKTDSIIEIKGNKGTAIRFAPKDLNTNSNKKFTDDSLQIELIELTSQQDLLLANAQTVSNGKWLVSGGAFKINIKDIKGQPLLLSKGKTIDVQFPINTNENDMKLFYGQRNKGGEMNWMELSMKLRRDPFVIFIDEGFVVDSVITKRYGGVEWYKSIGVIDTLGFIGISDLKKRFPRINFYNEQVDTIIFQKKRVHIIDNYYDGEVIDSTNFFRIKLTDSLYTLFNKKEVIIDSLLIDLENVLYSELREVIGALYKQITLKEFNQLDDTISREEYKKIRLAYGKYKEEVLNYERVSNVLYNAVQVSQLGWINIDKFAKEEEKVNLKLNYNIRTDHDQVYVIDESNNTVLNVFNDEIDLPINRSFKIITIGIKNKDIYGYKKSIRLVKKGKLDVHYKKINDNQLKTFLKI